MHPQKAETGLFQKKKEESLFRNFSGGKTISHEVTGFS